jgi:predicted enzyme related to lactoylglutathione lyase
MHTEPMIAVRDVTASVRWYKQLLACDNDHGRPDFDSLMHDGDVLLMLHQLEAPEHGMRAPIAGAEGCGVLVWFYVDDLDAVLRRAKRMKVPLVVEPHDNPQAGWREATIRDPDGYHLVLVET